jgi:hypothetical protein
MVVRNANLCDPLNGSRLRRMSDQGLAFACRLNGRSRARSSVMTAATIFLGGLVMLATNQRTTAAESSTELALGGLVLSKFAETIAIDSETINIGPEWVSISYHLSNQTAAPVSLTLTIPLPELDFSDPDVTWAIPGSDPINFVDLTAKIENKPTPLIFSQVARLNGRDISAMLHQNNLALIPVGTFDNQLLALAPDLKTRLSESGLLAQIGNDVQGNPLFSPTWTVQTSATKPLTLAPNQSIQLEFRYRASVGTSPDTFLRRPLRTATGLLGQVQRYQSSYCIDDAFYNGLDKIAGTVESNNSKLRERRIFYRLTAGGSNRPIKDFRLVVDKGRPDWIVSFCVDNLKRTSATTFEMRATDFVPSQDLRILMVGRN